MKSPIKEALGREILVADGAMGTLLQQKHGDYSACLDAYNLSASGAAIVAEIHSEYIDAGAQIIETNTFGANRVKLEAYGLAEQTGEIARRGAEIALAAAGERAYVAGAVGPLEFVGVDNLEAAELFSIFSDPINALAEAGVDYILLETFQEEPQILAALEVSKNTGLPVVLQVGGLRSGYTRSGLSITRVVEIAESYEVAALGANCRGPYDIIDGISEMAKRTRLPLTALPNAGYPEIERGRVVFKLQSDSFAADIKRLADAGASVIGGCCGTDPSHIKIIAKAVAGMNPAPRAAPHAPAAVEVISEKTPQGPEVGNPLKEAFERPSPLISVELRPSRDHSIASLLAGAKELARAGADMFDVPDNAGANVAYDTMVASHMIQSGTGLPTIMHLTTTQMNLVRIQSYLLGAWELGITGVLAITGDHPNVGDHDRYANRVADIKNSVTLIQLIKTMNEGKLWNQAPLKVHPDFMVGCGTNPNVKPEGQVKWLEKKIAAGADFCFTQPVYDTDNANRFRDACPKLEIPLLLGILPVLSIRNARFLASGKIPGIVLPDSLIQELERLPDPADQAKAGMARAHKLIEDLTPGADGFYIIPPFGKTSYQCGAELIRSIRAKCPRPGQE
jgi:methionine synthase / methylenetetrahydrofolate reductase (NADH)